MRIAPTITMNSLSNYNVYNAGYSRAKQQSVLVSLVKIVVSFILQQLLSSRFSYSFKH